MEDGQETSGAPDGWYVRELGRCSLETGAASAGHLLMLARGRNIKLLPPLRSCCLQWW